MGTRMTVQKAESLGLLDRCKQTFARPAKSPFEKSSKPKAPAVRFPKQYVQETPVDGGGILYQTPANAWLMVSDTGIVMRLPYPISANQIWRNHDNNTLLSESARKYRGHVHSMYIGLLGAICWKPYNDMLEVRMVVQPPLRDKNFSPVTYPRYDVDNYSKPILDALKCHKDKPMLFRDDRLVMIESVRFAEPVADGCVWLSCLPVDESGWTTRKPDMEWLTGNDR